MILCAAIFALALAGCSQPQLASPTVMPSPTTGTVIKTFTGKVTAIKGNDFTIDMLNSTMVFSTVGPEASDSSSNTGTSEPSPSPSVFGTTKDLTVVVPTNVAVTLADGKSGTIADIKVGNTVTFKIISYIVTAVTVTAVK